MIPVILSMLAYGLLHSVLASREVKSVVRERIGGRAYHGLYRVGFNVVAILTILPILWLVVAYPGERVYDLGEGWVLPLLAIRIAGLVGVLVALVQIDLWRFAGLRQLYHYITGRELPLRDEALTTSGVYGWVRHPLYLFSLMILWSASSMNEAMLGLNIGITLYFLVGSYYEEKRMIQSYGADYLAYCERVPWMFPTFKNKS
jgi:methanethiol S-methyltransferase